MEHVRIQIEQLRRYISRSEDREKLDEVDSLLGVALEEIRRRIATHPKGEVGMVRS